MKKLVIGVLSAGLLLGAGTALAAESDNGAGIMNFGQMLPFMQKMHPNMTNEQLQDMYNSCHGTGGAEPSKNFMPMGSSMMNM